MRIVTWILLGGLGIVFWSAVGSRFAPGHVIPDAALVTAVFVALRRTPIPVAVVAVSLGYLAGRQALAPIGLHETALVIVAVGVYIASGHLAGSGSLFFAVIAGGALMAYHLLLFSFSYAVTGHAGFASWTTASLLPGAVATGLLAIVSYPWMNRLELRLALERKAGLGW